MVELTCKDGKFCVSEKKMGTKGGLDVDLYLNFLAFEDTDENKPK